MTDRENETVSIRVCNLITLHLGKEWRFIQIQDEWTTRYEIKCDEHRGIVLDFNSWRQKERIVINAIMPAGNYHRIKGITVSVDRKPEAIARDIERRLLSGYFFAYKKAAEVIRSNELMKLKNEYILQAIIKVIPDSQYRIHKYYDGAFYISGYGKVKVSHCGKISLNLNYITPDTAIKMLAILGERINEIEDEGT